MRQRTGAHCLCPLISPRAHSASAVTAYRADTIREKWRTGSAWANLFFWLMLQWRKNLCAYLFCAARGNDGDGNQTTREPPPPAVAVGHRSTRDRPGQGWGVHACPCPARKAKEASMLG